MAKQEEVKAEEESELIDGLTLEQHDELTDGLEADEPHSSAGSKLRSISSSGRSESSFRR